MIRKLCSNLLTATICIAIFNQAIATEPQGYGDSLRYSVSFEIPELLGANRFAMSPDGRHVYCAAWRASSIVVFENLGNATLAHMENYQGPELSGVIKLSMSRDGSQLACICLRSNRICMFDRDASTGGLSNLKTSEAALAWPVAIDFSPDSRYLYVADAGGSSSSNAQSEVVVYEIRGADDLKEVARYGPENAQGMRNVMVSPDGKHCYACCSASGQVIAFERDSATGELQLVQEINVENSEAGLLDGVHSAKLSSDGKRLYCISGRFRGTSGVTVFDRLDDGKLEYAREISIESSEFSGGNDIVVSNDESTIIASGTTGDSIVLLKQDRANGKLTVGSTISAYGKINLRGASGLLYGPGEKALFVAAETGSAVTTFFVE